MDEAEPAGKRAPPTRQITIRLPHWLLDALEQEAREEGLAQASLMRSILTKHVRARGVRPPEEDAEPR